MKIVNLTVAGGYKPETEITRFFGKDSLPNGATSFRKKGIGGLTFWDPQNEDRKHKFKCIMVAFPDGLGVYCRNHRANYLVLIHKRELKSIDFVKEQDTMKPYAWSLYSLMMKAGISYHTASKYLMPVEIIHHDFAKCILRTEETFLTFELDKAHGGYAVQQSEEFLTRQRAEVQAHAAKADVIICTAQVRGRKAPVLIEADTVRNMRHGSVIVDLAASTGGNCALTENNKTIRVNGVTIIGNSTLECEMAEDASQVYGNNVLNLLNHITENGALALKMEDEIVKGSLIKS